MFKVKLFEAVFVLLFCFTASASAQVKAADAEQTEQATIEQILQQQADAWNDHDLDTFMGAYWNSEELTFSSGGKTTRGWQATLDNYKKNYPPEKMGTLRFDNLEYTFLGEDSALVLGQWHLSHAENRRADGNFSLVFRQLNSGWKVIHDHSSLLKPEEKEDE